MDRAKIGAGAAQRRVVTSCAILAFTAIALAVLLSLVNLIISDHNVEWDLTPNKRYSLTDLDKRVLSSLTAPVTVFAFVRGGDASYQPLTELLFQIKAFTPKVNFRIIDVDKSPGFAREYGVSAFGMVIVECQGRRRDFDVSSPERLIPSIYQASHPENRHIYFTSGHGERDIYDIDPFAGSSGFRMLLERDNYHVDNATLTAGIVPADATVLAALGPEKDFEPAELKAIADYLARGGHFIVAIDPKGSPSLASFLGHYYVDFGDRIIVDPANRISSGEMVTMQIPDYSHNNPITRTMNSPAVFSLARGVEIGGKVGDSAPGGLVFQRADSFLQSSDKSWASGDPNLMTTGNTEFKSGRDLRGPIPVGSEVDFTLGGEHNASLPNVARIVAFGSSSFVQNQFLKMMGNKNLAVSAVDEMAGDEVLIASRESADELAGAAFFFTNAQANHLLYLSAVLEPLILFAIAIAVFSRRRFFA